jgi:uncharacterized protein (TIGR02596 family)
MRTGTGTRAFTLIELLAVTAIIVVMMVLAAPAFTSLGKASALTNASRALLDEIGLARQTAMTTNTPVELRLFKLPAHADSTTAAPSQYRAVQTFLVQNTGTGALGKARFLDAPIVIFDAAQSSSIAGKLPEQTAPAGAKLPGVNTNYRYRSFRFKPDGSTDLAIDVAWYLTLGSANDPVGASGVPQNFITVQIDPQNGRTQVFRP